MKTIDQVAMIKTHNTPKGIGFSSYRWSYTRQDILEVCALLRSNGNRIAPVHEVWMMNEARKKDASLWLYKIEEISELLKTGVDCRDVFKTLVLKHHGGYFKKVTFKNAA